MFEAFVTLTNLGDVLLIFLFLSVILVGAMGTAYLYGSRLHPKVKFMAFTETGIWILNMRLYMDRFPTRKDLLSILLGNFDAGFPISEFSYSYFQGQKVYICQIIDGRIFPLPMLNRLGYADVYVQHCPKCGKSTSEMQNMLSCPDCRAKLVMKSEKISAVRLHEMKFNPSIESRALYAMDLKNNLIPISEWLTMYDVGKRIAELMDRSELETQKLLDRHNPFLTVIIATLPMAIIILGFALAVYIIFIGLGSGLKETAQLLYESTKLLKGG